MGADIDKRIELLRQFKKYEDTFYDYLSSNPKYSHLENLSFFLIPKNYVINFCKIFQYDNNMDELKQINIYCDNKEISEENKIIIKDLINNYMEKNKQLFKCQVNLGKIENKSMFYKRKNKKEERVLKLNEEGLFIPLIYNIWREFDKNYDSDIEIKKEGFLNKGEISILTQKNRVDSFFIGEQNNDFIYHFCFIIDETNDFSKLIAYLKNNSIREFLKNLNIDFQNIEKNEIKKIKIKLPSNIKDIGNSHITIYYLDYYCFHSKNYYNNNFLQFQKKEMNNNLRQNNNTPQKIQNDISINKIGRAHV